MKRPTHRSDNPNRHTAKCVKCNTRHDLRMACPKYDRKERK